MRSRSAVLLLGALLIAVVVAQSRGAQSRGTQLYDGPVALAVPSHSAAPSESPSWRAVIAVLDAARAAGYADPAVADPLDWVAADCPCLAVEKEALRRLAGQGRRLVVTLPEVVSAVAVAEADLAATVEVRDVLPAYDEVDAAGRTVRAWPGRGEASWMATLVRHDGGWRWAAWTRGAGHDAVAGVDPSRPG